ncbi:hypothetical protein QFC20_001728 [Naganishia adeliensis]|uniref:Uncharacterized protein n=1 Tax=Naganishia adeliensis TaxID=92952 RepID=A0ACC2WQY6_9TREE|nr:hypothetical protein QFC20_001728 [Naganishia adeliensis]
MASVLEYLVIPNRRDAVAVRAALESVITQAQTASFSPQERDSLIRTIMSDLADTEGPEAFAEKPIWKTWDVQTYETALECIKVLSRTPTGTAHLSIPAAIRTQIHHAQHSGEPATGITKGQQHAVSALCNTLLLHQNAPSLCVKEGLGDWALGQLAGDADKGQDGTWAFLMGRIIMVLTSRATYGFLERLVDELDGLSVFKARLEDTLEHPDRSQLALVEYMKILYHVFALYPETKGVERDQRFEEYILSFDTGSLAGDFVQTN